MPNWLKYIIVATGLALLAPGLCTGVITLGNIRDFGFLIDEIKTGRGQDFTLAAVIIATACWQAGCLGLSMQNLVLDLSSLRALSRICGVVGLMGVTIALVLVMSIWSAGNMDIMEMAVSYLLIIVPWLIGGLPALLVNRRNTAAGRKAGLVSPVIVGLLAIGLAGALSLMISAVMWFFNPGESLFSFAGYGAIALVPGALGFLLLRRAFR